MILTLTFLAIVLGACLPSIVWIIFFLREELHPAPSRLLIYAFGAGATSSIFVLVAQFGVSKMTENFPSVLLPLVLLAFIEEFFKFGGAYSILSKPRALVRPMDAMVFTVTAALGFASIENIFALASVAGSFDINAFYPIANTIVMRFVGATMLHALASGIAGYFWAKGTFCGKRVQRITLGILLATAVHVAFNYLVVMYQEKDLLIYPGLFLTVILFFVLTDFEILRDDEAVLAEKNGVVVQ